MAGARSVTTKAWRGQGREEERGCRGVECIRRKGKSLPGVGRVRGHPSPVPCGPLGVPPLLIELHERRPNPCPVPLALRPLGPENIVGGREERVRFGVLSLSDTTPAQLPSGYGHEPVVVAEDLGPQAKGLTEEGVRSAEASLLHSDLARDTRGRA